MKIGLSIIVSAGALLANICDCSITLLPLWRLGHSKAILGFCFPEFHLLERRRTEAVLMPEGVEGKNKV